MPGIDVFEVLVVEHVQRAALFAARQRLGLPASGCPLATLDALPLLELELLLEPHAASASASDARERSQRRSF